MRLLYLLPHRLPFISTAIEDGGRGVLCGLRSLGPGKWTHVAMTYFNLKYFFGQFNLFLTNAWPCSSRPHSTPPPSPSSQGGSRDLMYLRGYGGGSLRCMHHPIARAAPWSLPVWLAGLNPGTTLPYVSLVPFGLLKYRAGNHYRSPWLLFICL